MTIARVQDHNGTPTLFLDDKPVYGAVQWIPAPPSEGEWVVAPYVRTLCDAGVRIVHFGLGIDVADPEWDAPDDTGNTHYLERALPKMKRILDIYPDALFTFRIGLETYAEWWRKRHPEELELWSDGQRDSQSYASTVWREEAGVFLRDLVKFVRSSPEGQRVIAFQPKGGHAGEWVKESAMENRATDFSDPMELHFQSWLREKYGSVNALRMAWKDGRVMFNTAEVPSKEEQEGADLYHFRDPAQGTKVMDYCACFADLTARNIDHFCGIIKEASNGEVLAGAFYGYIMELTWSNGFFHQKQDLEHPAYQRSGHLALSKVLASPHVDFLASPYSYGFRGIGGDGTFMSLTESVRLHGKLWVNEEDSRTHTSPPGSSFGQAKNAFESVSILTRNFSVSLERSSACWWANGGLPGLANAEDPDIMAAIRRCVEIGGKSLQCPDRSPCADMAVIVDEQSFFYEMMHRRLAWPLIFRQRHWGLARLGAPHDLYLLSDLDRLPRKYKAYVFLNTFRATDDQRDLIRRTVCRDNALVVWMYMAGAINGNLSPENMSDLIGMNVSWDMTEWSLNLLVTGFDHPITANLPANTAWGTDERIGPIPYVDDPDAYALGTLVSIQGESRPGMCVKDMGDWTSLYVGAPNVPSNVLRSMLTFAGGHIFCHSDDVLHANRDFVSIHTTKGETKRLHLPGTADVWDAMADKRIASDADTFEDRLLPGETKLYYYGKSPWDELCP
ncbi:MAG: hypothetical protein GY851_00025 [bacterium]|nr:hypothetical protein [bacterium]